MKRHLHIALLLVTGLVCGKAASAQGDSTMLSLEYAPVVITVYRQIPEGAGAKQVSLDSANFRDFQNQNLSGLLSIQPSLHVKGYGSNGISTPAFRGTGAGHTQVFWNELPLNSSSLGLADMSTLPVAMATQVKLVFGLPSLTYGSGGLGGAILLSDQPAELSGRGEPLGYQHRLSQQLGSFGESRTVLKVNLGGEKLETGTHFSFNTAANDFPYQNTALPGSPVQRQVNSGLRQFSALQDLRLENVANGTLSAAVWGYDLTRSLPPTMLTTNSAEWQRDRGLRSRLAWEASLGRQRLKVQGGWFHEGLEYRNPVASIHSRSINDRLLVQASLGNDLAPSRKLFHFSGVQLRYLHDHAVNEGYPQGQNFGQVSGSVAGSLHPWKWLFITLRLREEVSGQGASPLLGVLGAQADWRKFTLYLNGGRNYRLPTLNDLYWSPGGNPNLLPEQNWTAELGLQRQIFRMDGRREMYFTASGYLNQVDNWILWVPGNASWWAPENVQQVLVRGGEFSLDFHSLQGQFDRLKMDVDLNYAITSSQVRSTGDPNDQSLGQQLIYTPKHTAQMMLKLRYCHWHLRYQHQFVGPRFTTRDNRESIAGYTLGNAFLGRNFKKGGHLIALQGGLDNVWNTSYQNVAWRPMPGRSFFVRLQWDFAKSKDI